MGDLMNAVRAAQAAHEGRRQEVAELMADMSTEDLKARIAVLTEHRKECCAPECHCDAFLELDTLEWMLARRLDANP